MNKDHMDRNLRLQILFGVLVFGIVLSFRLWQNQRPVTHISNQAGLSEVAASPLSNHLLAAVNEYLQRIEGPSAISANCRLEREKVLSQHVTDVIRDIQERRFILNPACRVFDQALLKVCRRQVMERNGFEECYRSFLLYKTNLVASSHRRAAVKTLDAESLIYVFLDGVWQGDLRRPEEVQRLNQISDRLIEFLPDSPHVRKAAVLPRLVADFERLSRGSELSPETDAYLNEAIRLNPQDAELEEVQIFRRVVMDRNKISLEKAAELVVEKPKSSLAHYFLASAFESKGEHKEALSTLKKAMEMEPKNERYRQTFEKLIQGEKSAFVLNLGLSFDGL